MKGVARRRGQAVIEFGLAVPVLAIMLYSTYSVGVLASDRVASIQAARAGARLAAELGGTDSGWSDLTDHDNLDRQIVSQVMAVALALNYATVQEIDIYPACAPTPAGLPCQSNQYQDTSNPALDRRLPNGDILGGQNSFTLNLRSQIPPNETSMGVRVIYTYNPPVTVGFFTITIREWAVMKATPVFG